MTTTNATCPEGGTQARARSRRTRWRIWLVSAAALAFLLLLGLVVAATYRPAWYAPAPIDFARLRDDKAALAALEDEISAALNAGREIRLQINAAQINRWLAARAEIWPQAAIPLANLDQPQVLLRDGQFSIGATGSAGEWRAVVALTGTVTVHDDRVSLELLAAHVGAVPIPAARLTQRLAGLVADHGHLRPTGDGRTLSLPNEWVWPNGKRRCRLREVSIRAGVMEVVLQPMPAP